MNSLSKFLVIIVVFNCKNLKAQGILACPDNSVNAVVSSSAGIPKTETGIATWTSTNAYMASPLIYRSRQFPDNGTGAFPFNEYEELMIQGTSHEAIVNPYNKGISFLTWDGSSALAQIRMRGSPTGNIGIETASPTASLEINSPALAGASETLFKLSVSDEPKDYLRIANCTMTNGQFIPALNGYRISDNKAYLYLTATTEPVMDNGTSDDF
jgi:hypothetical protein